MTYIHGSQMAARHHQIVQQIEERGLCAGNMLTDKGRTVVQRGFRHLDSVMEELLAAVQPFSSGRDALHYNLSCYLWHTLSSDSKDILRRSAEKIQLPVAVFPLLAGMYIMERARRTESTRSYIP